MKKAILLEKKKECIKMASLCNSKKEFRTRFYNQYQYARNHGFKDECFDALIPMSIEEAVDRAKMYTTVRQFKNNQRRAYDTLDKAGILDEVFADILKDSRSYRTFYGKEIGNLIDHAIACIKKVEDLFSFNVGCISNDKGFPNKEQITVQRRNAIITELKEYGMKNYYIRFTMRSFRSEFLDHTTVAHAAESFENDYKYNYTKEQMEYANMIRAALRIFLSEKNEDKGFKGLAENEVMIPVFGTVLLLTKNEDGTFAVKELTK